MTKAALTPIRSSIQRQDALSFIQISARERLSGEAQATLIDSHNRVGFALFELASSDEEPTDPLMRFAEGIGLGKPFVPPLYRSLHVPNYYERGGFNVVTAASSSVASHPAFETRSGLEFHTDGTLHPIGEIRTALLFCIEPAAEGGDTTIFQACEAFQDLASTNPDLAEALLSEAALIRHTTFEGATTSSAGPVFEYIDGEICTRYSVTHRDEWNEAGIKHLREARRALALMAAPGSRYYIQLRLGVRQGILIANDRVSHGRTEFADSEKQTRKMLRSLFVNRPSGCSRA